ncbi:MAG TPA: Spy/CpxP family protein refolding chaperone, partial [Novosphingobium sp.]|nr:Spy/CpxP family protein refolding chaperone [Novosphingobium sp.]
TTPEAAMRALHEALHLSAQQEPAWQAYRARALQASQAQGRQQAAARLLPTLDAPHRMDLVEAEMRAELAEQHNQAQLVKALYAQLSPNQRAIFDQRTLPRQSGQ